MPDNLLAPYAALDPMSQSTLDDFLRTLLASTARLFVPDRLGGGALVVRSVRLECWLALRTAEDHPDRSEFVRLWLQTVTASSRLLLFADVYDMALAKAAIFRWANDHVDASGLLPRSSFPWTLEDVARSYPDQELFAPLPEDDAVLAKTPVSGTPEVLP